LARVLTAGAEFRFATDHPEYCRWTLYQVIRHGAFEWLAETPENWRDRLLDWPKTRYEAKARAAGRRCYYLRFRRLSDPSRGK
jgi:tRNA (guanine-N7-)-methyltransferase